MLRLLIDQDLDHDILRALIRRVPDLDALTAFDIGMSDSTDSELLRWARSEDRVVLTHDRRTMPAHAAELISNGHSISGLIIAARSIPLYKIIEDLELAIKCSENDEWVNIIIYLPL